MSLIAPFYNGEEYLARFLVSILKQTYKNVQFILINDGSKDRSDDIVEEYRRDLTESFYEFIYLKKINEGAASAVNLALKYVKGEYLCWADCDDEMLPDNILLKLRFLQENEQYGMVNCGAVAVDESNGETIKDLSIPIKERNDNMFEKIIAGIPVYPGVFMLRSQLLFEKISNREIYFNREAGQNYQLLLPVAYDNKCGFIDDILYKYYIRSDSHSHDVDYKKSYERTYVREMLLDKVLTFMDETEKKTLMQQIKCESSTCRFNMAFQADDKYKANESFDELKLYSVSLKNYMKHLIINCKLLNKFYRLRGNRK